MFAKPVGDSMPHCEPTDSAKDEYVELWTYSIRSFLSSTSRLSSAAITVAWVVRPILRSFVCSKCARLSQKSHRLNHMVGGVDGADTCGVSACFTVAIAAKKRMLRRWYDNRKKKRREMRRREWGISLPVSLRWEKQRHCNSRSRRIQHRKCRAGYRSV